MILPNPLDMFDIRGRIALIAGAFGSVAARVLARVLARAVAAFRALDILVVRLA